MRHCLECGCDISSKRKDAVYCTITCKERARSKRRDWSKENRPNRKPQNNRWYMIKRAYGLTQEEWEDMFESQGNACANSGCRATEPGAHGYWHTDHDHKTGKVRGILCHRCNLMIGMAKDQQAVLSGAIAYLSGAMV